jgi:tol-pal system protein YbgF
MSSGMNRTRSFALAAAIASMFVVVPPAAAQRASLAERVAALEQRAANNQGNVDLLNQVTQLKAEVSSLRSQIEELQQANEQAQSTARAQYLDLDGRLNRLEGAGAPISPGAGLPAAPDTAQPSAAPGAIVAPPASGAAAPVVAAVGADERASYEAAFDVLKAGRYDESARLFQQFLQQHPDGAYAPNARYWLGESYYVTQNYELALEQFKALYERYPTHDKAPGALLKVGLSQYGLKQMDAARETLTQVTQKYPGSDAARTADDRLRSIELGVR